MQRYPLWSPPPYSNPCDYPVNALGPIIAPAVIQHHQQTGIAIEAIGTCALAIAHLAVQDLVDVQRPNCAPSPCSAMFCLISGPVEGKDTSAAPFVAPIRKIDLELSHTSEKALLQHEAETAAWQAELKSVKKRLEAAADDYDDLTPLTKEYESVLARRPEPPKAPQIIHDNTTSAGLARSIINGSRSIFLFSTEAGGIFNGPLGRSNALINSFYDSTPIPWNRADSRGLIDDYRVTALLAAQPVPFRKYLDRWGKEAEGSGTLSRLMLTGSHSTLGTRFISATPSDTSGLSGCAECIESVLRLAIRRRKDEHPRRIVQFDHAAANLFVDIYNNLQENMAPGSILSAIPGQAGRTAEHIARIACTMHTLEQRSGPIDCQVLERARQIGDYHLNQYFLMFAPGQAGDQRETDARAIASAVCDASRYGIEYFSRKELKSWCRTDLSASRFHAALFILMDRGLVTAKKDGRGTYIMATPSLLFRTPNGHSGSWPFPAN